MMKGHSQKIINHVFNLLMIALGTIGVVGGFYFSLEFPKIASLGLLLLIVFGWLLYNTYIFSYHHLRYGLLFCVCLIICVVYMVYIDQTKFFFDKLKDVIIYDYYLSFDSLLKTHGHLFHLLPIVILMTIGIPVVLLIVSLICQKEKNGLKLVGLLFLYFLPALILHPLNNYTSYCFIVFFMYGFLFYGTLKYQHHQNYLHILYTFGLVILLCLSSLFLEKNPIFNQRSTTVLTNIIHWIDHSRFVNGANITGASYQVDGSLPTGNISTNNFVALTVKSTRAFSSYLRSYSLAHYENNQWNNKGLETQKIDSLEMYLKHLNDYAYPPESFLVSIDSPSTRYQIVPYYSQLSEEFIDDSYYIKTHYQFNVFLDDRTSIGSMYHPFRSNQQSYNAYVYENYLDVPENLSKKLTDLLNERIIEKYGYDEASLTYQQWVDFVKEILEEETSYTLNAGNLPNDKDFVEYFLFENKKGSCTHYATTGALMLRCAGIPTRFVKGFVLKESDFENGEAEVKNNRSHAWIEIYIDSVGWVPYEMTPSNNNTINSIGDMLDNPSDDDPVTPQNPNTPNNPQRPQQNQESPTMQEPTVDDDFFKMSFQVFLKYQKRIIHICIIVLFLIVYRVMTHKWFFMRIRKYDRNRQMIKYYLRLEKISRFGRAIDEDIKQVAYKAKFSQHQITEEESIQMQTYYHIFVKETYQSLEWYKKIIYKYVLGYI